LIQRWSLAFGRMDDCNSRKWQPQGFAEAARSQPVAIQLDEQPEFALEQAPEQDGFYTNPTAVEIPAEREPEGAIAQADEPDLMESIDSLDYHAIVLLHAFAGSGKTSTAAEFGRWYALTGGLLEAGKQGHVLFTTFQRYLPLSRVLDKLGQVFERDLERSGIQ
jgi:hypothetical protein